MPSDPYSQTPKLHWPHPEPMHPSVASGVEANTSLARNAPRYTPEDAKRRRRKYGPKPEPPYSCFCGKVFKRHEHMLRHRATHDDGIKYDCTICGKSFRRQDVMHRHTLTHKNSSSSRNTYGLRGKGRRQAGDDSGSSRKVPLKESSNISPARSANTSDGSHHANSPSYRSYAYSKLPKYPSSEALNDHQTRSSTPVSLAQHRSPSLFDSRAASLPLDMPMMGMTPPPPFQAPTLLNTLPFSNALGYPAFMDEHTGERVYGYGSSSVDSGYMEGTYRDDASEWANDGASRLASPCLSTMAVYDPIMPTFAPRDYDFRNNCAEAWPVSVPSQTEAQSNLTAVVGSSFPSPFHQTVSLPMYSPYLGGDHPAARNLRHGNNGICSPVMSDALSARGGFTTPRNYFESPLPTMAKPNSTSEVFASSNLSRFVHNQQLATPTPGAMSSFHLRSPSPQHRRPSTHFRSEEDFARLNVEQGRSPSRGMQCDSSALDPFASASPLTDISDQDSARPARSPAAQHGKNPSKGSSLIDPNLVSPVPLRLDHLPAPFSVAEKAN